jgi:transcriptional regulator with XRE-family HTH domain
MKRKRIAPRVKLNRDAVWDLLDELNMSQNELARLCGLSSGYFSQLMSGVKSPSPRVRRKMQKVLGVTDFDRLFIIEWPDGDGAQTSSGAG